MEKIILSAGAVGDQLDKAYKLLGRVSGEKIVKTMTTKRIPTWGVRPKLEVGCKVTVRGKKAEKLLKRLLAAVDNVIKEKQIANNHFSFGIKEYIEIPDMEYQRDIGVMGFNTTVDFARPGVRVKRRRMKKNGIPKRQEVSVEEIKTFMQDKYGVKVI
ncbi:MAG: 50S ribosomal protein L5 [Nanoarchaeota archaeon]